MQEVIMAVGRPPLMQMDCVEQNSSKSDAFVMLSTIDAVRCFWSAFQKLSMNRSNSEKTVLK